VTASGLRAMLITGLISQELRREDLPPATFGSPDQQELLLAETADRSVLGCMTDMAPLCRSTPRWSSDTGPGRAELSRRAAL
jgi:hypothetical protein